MVFEKKIDCGDFVLEKIIPDTKNAESLLNVINNNRDHLAPYLEWVDSYTTTEKTLANITKSYSDDICAYFIIVDNQIAGKIGFVDVDDGESDGGFFNLNKFFRRK